jgi:hypothetical protein
MLWLAQHADCSLRMLALRCSSSAASPASSRGCSTRWRSPASSLPRGRSVCSAAPAACCGWRSTLTALSGCSLFAALPSRHLRHHHAGALLAGALRHHRYLAGARSARSVPATCCGWLSTLTAPFEGSLFAALPLRHLRHHHAGALLADALRDRCYLAGARSALLFRPHAGAGSAR